MKDTRTLYPHKCKDCYFYCFTNGTHCHCHYYNLGGILKGEPRFHFCKVESVVVTEEMN